MAKRIGILTVHGMGEQKPDFDQGLRQRLSARLPGNVRNDVAFQTVFYQDVMQGNQAAAWGRMAVRKLRWEAARRFFLYSFSDAATYEHTPQAADSVYRKVHGTIRQAVDTLRGELESDASPVVVIAHSLGCQVISNYIWDAAAGKGVWAGAAPTGFQKFGTLRYMFTAGCNIPLFVSGLAKIEAIYKPNPDFQWLNFYDNDDFLGWPLKPLSTGFANSYDTVVARDIEMNASGLPGFMNWLKSWTPAAHTAYWTSDGFVKPVAENIARVHAGLP